jgi:hypothetical protein
VVLHYHGVIKEDREFIALQIVEKHIGKKIKRKKTTRINGKNIC